MKTAIFLFVITGVLFAEDAAKPAPELTDKQRLTYMAARLKLLDAKQSVIDAEKEQKEAIEDMIKTCGTRPINMDFKTQLAFCGQEPPVATPAKDDTKK